VDRERPALRVIEGGEPPGALAPAAEFAALGAGLTLTLALLGRLASWYHNLGTFQALFTLAFALFALTMLRLRRYERLPHAGLAVLAVAVCARVALLPVVPSLSDDLYRYLWEGRVIVHGGNPWQTRPDDPRLAPLRDRALYPRVNHPELATIYPPLAEAGFALVARLSPTVTAFKVWIALHDLALVLLLLAWARRRGESVVPVIAYAWNPLVLVEYAGSGHNDPTAMVWLVLALMLARERPVGSALALAAGALTKLAPLVALPFLLPRWPWRARAAALGVLALGLGWFWSQTRGGSSGLTAYWETWRNNELAFFYLARLAGGFKPARTASIAILAAVLLLALWKGRSAEGGSRLALRGALLLSPVLHPWYLGWALALEPLAPSAPWLLLSFTSILNYGVFAVPGEGRDFHLPLAWRWVEYGLPLVLALVLAARARVRTARAHATP
jgi:hypothetical protein